MLQYIFLAVIGFLGVRIAFRSTRYPPKGAVLISGASSGIGHDTAIHLDKIGLTVFAGVRSQKDFDSLRSKLSSKSTPVVLDVTMVESVTKCVAIVEQKLNESGEILIGLIDNAGVAEVCPVEGLQVEDVKKQFEVNVFGAIRLNNAFLPLLKKANGRGTIIMVSSVWGIVSQAFFSTYSMTKYSIEALADAMRVEFKYCNIPVRVALIEPGGFKTEIVGKHKESISRNLGKLQQPLKDFYQKEMDDIAHIIEHTDNSLIPPVKVVMAMEEALLAVNPKARYLVLPKFRLDDLLLYLPSGKFRDLLIVSGFRAVVNKVRNLNS